ncbi:MAG: adenylate/guanylate cyclase domain-containing protein [Candidatus Eremiobacterota bacterium]
MNPHRVPHPVDRLNTLARVISIASSIPDLEAVLEILMDHLVELVGAERGFIMLVNPESGALEFRTARNFSKETLYEENFQVSRSIIFQVFQGGHAVLTSNAQEDERFQTATSIQEFGLRAVMCAPISVAGEALGVLYVDNRLRLGAFEPEDLAFLQTFADQASSVIDRTRLAHDRARLQDLFSRYVSPEVVGEILARPGDALTAQRRRVTVLFVDIRGFSALAETTEPARLLEILNDTYEAMLEVLFAHRGTILSFLGDGLLAVFGAPLELPDQEAKAIQCARNLIQLAEQRSSLKFGAGLATGEAIVGDLGGSKRRDYTVVGDPVNTAARLEKLTKSKGVPVLADDETWRASGLTGGRNLGTELLAGKQRPVTLWAV